MNMGSVTGIMRDTQPEGENMHDSIQSNARIQDGAFLASGPQSSRPSNQSHDLKSSSNTK